MPEQNRQLRGLTLAFRVPVEVYDHVLKLAEQRGHRTLSPTLRDLVLSGLQQLGDAPIDGHEGEK